MGYSFYACMADTISPNVVAAVAPSAWAAFQTALTAVATHTGITPDELLKALGREEEYGNSAYHDDELVCEAITIHIVPALDNLKTAFQNATGGLILGLGYVYSDSLRGSDLCDETYWYIDNHHQPTPAYAAFQAAHGTATTTTWIYGG